MVSIVTFCEQDRDSQVKESPNRLPISVQYGLDMMRWHQNSPCQKFNEQFQSVTHLSDSEGGCQPATAFVIEMPPPITERVEEPAFLGRITIFVYSALIFANSSRQRQRL
jgi:hypothetical protein